MRIRRMDRLAALALGLATAGAFALIACSDDETAGDGPVSSIPLVDGSSGTTSEASLTNDSGGVTLDSGSSSSSGAVPKGRTLTLANMDDTLTINLCTRKDKTEDAYVALFATGLVKETVSAPLALTLDGNTQVKVIDVAAGGCEGPSLALSTLTLATQSDDTKLGLSYAFKSISGYAPIFEATAGKDSILVQPPYSDAVFTPDGSGEPIKLRGAAGKPVLLEAGVVGTISLPAPSAVTRKFKAVGGGTVSLFATQKSGITLCDEREAHVRQASYCPADLRAP